MRFLQSISSTRHRWITHAGGLLILGLLLGARLPASAFSATDANLLAGAYNSSFYTVSGTNGYFKDTQTGGIAYFWGQAEMIECVIDAYEWTSNSVYHAMITNLLNGFLKNNGSWWQGNMYNDDIMWAVIAFARGGRLTGNIGYCNIAKANFDPCFARAWDSKLGGGLYWTTDNNTKNACVNGPGSIAASLLYQIYGDPAYSIKASNTYAWERSVLFNTNTGAIYDAIGTNGVINTWASTYNQGTFIGAADFLDQTNDARLAAHYTMTRMTSGGILPEYGIAGNNSGFNAIFLRWMTRFMKRRNLDSLYQPWLQQNAAAAWGVRRAFDNLSWCEWRKPSPNGTNFYAWDCISSFEVLHAAQPTQPASSLPVPADYVGYWPLDSLAGTSVADLSGRGNSGVVSGAAFNANGRLNGCLSFNGSNASVQITNPLSTDFTISFWVKTTQPGGAGQWYNGFGLVDGDVSSVYNDFGTALVGGKLAFGIGNPDTTILSPISIADGAWHHCVATRQRALGVSRLYVDGQLQATGLGHKNTLSSPAKLLFGALASGNGFFQGSLDDIKLFARALNANEVVGLFTSMVSPPAAPPPAVTAVPGNTRVDLAWGEAPAATSYNVKRSLYTGGPYVTLTNVAATSWRDTGVVNGRAYFYLVSPVNLLGEGPASAEATATPSPLTAWFTASTLAALTNGAPVSAWPDLTGHGFDALQTIAACRPTFASNTLNGFPAVRFNAAGSNYLWLYRPVQDDFTLMVVFQSSQGLGTGTQFYEGAGLLNGEVPGAVGDFGISLNANGQVLAGVGNPDTTLRSGTGLNDGRPHIISFKRTRTSGGLVLYVDGTAVATGSAGTQTLTAPNLLVLGAQQVFNNFLSGDIAEVQIYSTALSDVERVAKEQALRCKYGFSGGVTPAAPAGLVGNAGNRSVSLNWLSSPGASTYQVWRARSPAGPYTLVADALPTTSFLDTTAVNGAVNYYRVTGVNACGTGSNSTIAAVLLPLPSMSMTCSNATLNLSWPLWASDWILYSATNLHSGTVWIPVPAPVGTNNGQFLVSVPVGQGMQFFRLVSP